LSAFGRRLRAVPARVEDTQKGIEQIGSRVEDTQKGIEQIGSRVEDTQKGIEELAELINFRFHEVTDLRAIHEMSLRQGATIRRLLGHEALTIRLITDKPIAVNSLDHIHPWGTKQDNSKNLNFNLRLFEWIPLESLRVLDIGCSGGGFVKTIHDAGALAIGIEGSDYSKVRARAEWATIPTRLFTADATAPFTILANDSPLKFTVITAWEFIEHIEEPSLEVVFNNIDRHLDVNGVVIMSVSPNDDWVDGVNLHRTIHEAGWWFSTIQKFGFTHHPELIPRFSPDNWIRYEENAPNSFHLVLTRATDIVPPWPTGSTIS
jgi:2-polyprenyl-3-methyl-5-hydroxy-6-metoxy-1,4-benzoquinol methylase